MGTVKSYHNPGGNGPSTFALLVDNINKMSESEQKVLWLQINKDKLSTLAKELDSSVTPHNFSEEEVALMINEAKKNGRPKKKN